MTKKVAKKIVAHLLQFFAKKETHREQVLEATAVRVEISWNQPG